MRKRLFAAVFSALVLVGCGLGSEDAGPATPKAFPPAEGASDKAITEQLVLTQEDMPEGFTAAPSNPLPSIGALQTQPESCKAAISAGASESVNTAGTQGAAFRTDPNAGSVLVTSAAIMAPTVTSAGLQQDIWVNSRNQLCARRLLEPLWKSALPQGVDPATAGGDLNLTAIKSFQNTGYGAVRLIGSIAANRQTQNVYLDVITINVDRTVVFSIIAGVGTEPSLQDEEHLANRMKMRVTNALVKASPAPQGST